MSKKDRPLSEEIEGQKLPYPARQSDMNQQPASDLSDYKPADKLKGKVAIITGGDKRHRTGGRYRVRDGGRGCRDSVQRQR